MIGHQRDQPLGADRVARIEHGVVRLGAEHREILERHLRRPVFANRHAGVRAGQLDADVADRGHADEVGGARQEAGERRGERNRAARRQAHRGADHHLLGDEVLVEAIGRDLLELVAEGRVLDVGVERDDARVGLAELGERGAVGFARRDLIAQLVGGRRDGFGASTARGCRRRLRNLRREVRRRAASGTGTNCFSSSASARSSSSPFLNALPCQPSLPFDERHAFALDRARQDHRRLALGASCASASASRICVDVVAVDDDRVPAERLPAARELLHVVLATSSGGSGRGALTSVMRAQVVELVDRGDVGRFPDRAFRRFAVAEQARRCGSRT